MFDAGSFMSDTPAKPVEQTGGKMYDCTLYPSGERKQMFLADGVPAPDVKITLGWGPDGVLHGESLRKTQVDVCG